MSDAAELYLKGEELKLCDAEPGQIEFLAWYRREQWRKNEERRMRVIVDLAFEGCEDSLAESWKRWCHGYLCHRFNDMTRWEWVPALAALDEEWLWHGPKDGKTFRYLKMVRDTAVKFVEENHLEGRKGVDI